jgi:20S proteasome subunit beta 3
MHVLILFVWCVTTVVGNIHGGSFIALAGKDSVVFASDSRFSVQGVLLGDFPQKVLRVGDSTFVLCSGLEGDAASLQSDLRDSLMMTGIADDVTHEEVTGLVSHLLYSGRYYLSPIVVSLCGEEPFISSMDSLGARTDVKDFAVCGAARSSLYSTCEGLFSPGLDAPSLQKLAQRCFLSATNRDTQSGGDITVYAFHKGKLFFKKIANKKTGKKLC